MRRFSSQGAGVRSWRLSPAAMIDRIADAIEDLRTMTPKCPPPLKGTILPSRSNGQPISRPTSEPDDGSRGGPSSAPSGRSPNGSSPVRSDRLPGVRENPTILIDFYVRRGVQAALRAWIRPSNVPRITGSALSSAAAMRSSLSPINAIDHAPKVRSGTVRSWSFTTAR